MSNLILPGNPLFDLTLETIPPPGWQNHPNDGEGVAMVVDSQSGLLRPVNEQEMIDYVWGGEYEERLEAIGENADY